MAIEWTALWIHFLWSGSLVFIFSMGTYREIHKMQKNVKTTAGQKKDTTLDDSKRRLLNIALFTSFCLLLNIVVTIITLGGLDEWGSSTDVWLDCSIAESFYTRDWDAYELSDHQQVCTSEEVTKYQGTIGCAGSCTWMPEKHTDFMICAIDEGVVLEDVITGFPADGGEFGEKYTYVYRYSYHLHTCMLIHVYKPTYLHTYMHVWYTHA